MTRKIKAHSYLRFSTNRQRNGSSFRRQQAAIDNWLKQNPHYELQKKQYKDEGKSGFKAEHLIKKGALKLLLEAIENGDIHKGDAILVERFSRLTRQKISGSEKILFKIWEYGITFIVVSENDIYPPESIDDDRDRTQLLGEIKLAHRESQIKSDFAKSSYMDRMDNAIKALEIHKKDNTKPLPNIKLPSMPFWLDKNGKLNGKEIIIKEIFKLYNDGYGQFKIRLKIIEKFPEMIEAQRMNSTSILRWIKSKKVLGIWEYQKKEAKIFDAAIDDENLFTNVQLEYESKKKKRLNPDKNWELKGLCVCGYCGSTMSVQNIPRSFPNLRCTKRQRLGTEACESSPSFPYIVAKYFFENKVKRDLERILSNSIINKSDQISLNKIEYELIKNQEKLTEIEEEYLDNNGSKVLLKMIIKLEGEFEGLKNEQQKIKDNFNIRSYLSDDIRELEKNPIKQNQLFNRIGLRMTIKDNKIEFDNEEDSYYLIYEGYKRKDKRFNFRKSWADLNSSLKYINDSINSPLSKEEAEKLLSSANKYYSKSDILDFITRDEAEKFAK